MLNLQVNYGNKNVKTEDLTEDNFAKISSTAHQLIASIGNDLAIDVKVSIYDKEGEPNYFLSKDTIKEIHLAYDAIRPKK